MTDLHIEQLSLEPDFIALHRHEPARYPFFVESVAHGTAHGRYDILFAFPQDEICLDAQSGTLAEAPDFLDALDAQLELTTSAHDATSPGDDVLPFRGGWFVYLGYELAGQIEPTLQLPLPGQSPIAYAVRIPIAIIRDHLKGSCYIVAESSHIDCLSTLKEDIKLARSFAASKREMLKHTLLPDQPERFTTAVKQAQQHIVDGDVFQANLSRQWQAEIVDDWSDAEMYRRLRLANPAPFAGLAVWRDMAIISSSPERLIRLHDGRIDTRPIAGTRPRGAGHGADVALSRELIGHPKERAEHIMLIDLERNDLGRVCEPGSVEVNELMVIESYAHVHHIVSNVRGMLRSGVSPGQALRATFPGGTITGCPKVRCMEIIAALEATPRGPYTGSMGYLNHDGSGDFNILIRTIVREGNKMSFRAGAGIVMDSDAEKELAETGFKAKGLIRAIDPLTEFMEQGER